MKEKKGGRRLKGPLLNQSIGGEGQVKHGFLQNVTTTQL